MKWQNLKENKCPKCDKDLAEAFNPVTKMFECSCGFKIREAKFNQIVSGIINKDLSKKLDEEYNNG